MPKFSKTLLAGAVGLVAFGGVGSSAVAQEGTGHQGPLAQNCWGTKQETRILKAHVGGQRIGRIELWYSPEQGGTNCVITYNEVPGKALTYAYLIVDDNKNRDNTGRKEPGDRVAYDQGNYEYYAGASYLRKTNGKCVKFGGSVIARAGDDSFGSVWTHCS
jgi:hypothetical protein